MRANAEKLGVSVDRVGIMGFSAGGHLASTAATHFNDGEADSSDPLDAMHTRPDFAILGYPVISFTTEYTHKGSRTNLLGDTPDPELVELLSNENQVTAETPVRRFYFTPTKIPQCRRKIACCFTSHCERPESQRNCTSTSADPTESAWRQPTAS